MMTQDTSDTTISLRELKRRYKMNLAQGKALPAYDQPISLPLSTGNPLFDTVLTQKLTSTTTMGEAEHLNRGWNLVKSATPGELQALSGVARGLLNDYKLLLALRAWDDGDEAMTRTFLRALPWHWRLAFPTAVIKPSSQMFTGWKRSIKFRLVENPHYGALYELYRELLAQAPPVSLLKYRRTVHEATALLHYRFEGERERAIHDWCYAEGNAAALNGELEPIGAYVRARQALRTEGISAMLDVLNSASHPVPITSYMGLLGSSGISLKDDTQEKVGDLRTYAVTCASSVESLLRMAEWGEWLNKSHVQTLSNKVKTGILETGLDIPFFKVTKAFLAAPDKVRKMVLDPLYLPLLKHFGAQTAALLPPPNPITFLQPSNYLHMMSFLLYASLSATAPTQLLLIDKKGIDAVDPIPLETIGKHLADSRRDFEEWLLAEFGGLAMRYDYTYNWKAVGKAIDGLDPKAPLVLDLPFADDLAMLQALLPFERVFNLGGVYGAPGELCIAYEYYCDFFIGNRRSSMSVWTRYSDSATQKFGEVMDRLSTFQKLAQAQDNLLKGENNP
jgi:hypothetical protein